MKSSQSRQVFKQSSASVSVAKKAAPSTAPPKLSSIPSKKVAKVVEEEVKQVTNDTNVAATPIPTPTDGVTGVVESVAVKPAAVGVKSASAIAAAAAEKKAAAEAKKLRTSIVAAAKAAIGRVGVAPIDAGAVKKSHIVIIKGQPCKIMDVKHSKTGKHGHTRVRMTGISLLAPFAKLECLYPAHIMIPQCNVNKGVYQLLSIVGEAKRQDSVEEAKHRAALELALPAMTQTGGNDNDDKEDDEEVEVKRGGAAKKGGKAVAVDSDTDDASDDSDHEEVSEEEVASDYIVVDILDGKYPRRIACGIEASAKEELLASRATDTTNAGEYVYQITIVEAPLLPANRKMSEDEMADDVNVRATLQLWRRVATADLPKKR